MAVSTTAATSSWHWANSGRLRADTDQETSPARVRTLPGRPSYAAELPPWPQNQRSRNWQRYHRHEPRLFCSNPNRPVSTRWRTCRCLAPSPTALKSYPATSRSSPSVRSRWLSICHPTMLRLLPNEEAVSRHQEGLTARQRLDLCRECRCLPTCKRAAPGAISHE